MTFQVYCACFIFIHVRTRQKYNMFHHLNYVQPNCRIVQQHSSRIPNTLYWGGVEAWCHTTHVMALGLICEAFGGFDKEPLYILWEIELLSSSGTIRYLGLIVFSFHVLQLLPIRYTQWKLYCKSKSRMTHQQKRIGNHSAFDLVVVIRSSCLLIS